MAVWTRLEPLPVITTAPAAMLLGLVLFGNRLLGRHRRFGGAGRGADHGKGVLTSRRQDC